MMTAADYEKINEIVSAPNARHIIIELINTYGLQSPENASFIMDEATKLSIFMMKHYGEKAVQYKAATEELLVDETSLAQPKEHLLHLLRICMPIFPEGNVRAENTVAETKYFDRLLNLLKAPMLVFDWDNKADWKWARANGVDAYLKLLKYRNAAALR